MKKSSSILMMGALLFVVILGFWWWSSRGIGFLAFKQPSMGLGSSSPLRDWLIRIDTGSVSFSRPLTDPFGAADGFVLGFESYKDVAPELRFTVPTDEFYNPTVNGFGIPTPPLGQVVSGVFDWGVSRERGFPNDTPLVSFPLWFVSALLAATTSTFYFRAMSMQHSNILETEQDAAGNHH